MWAGHRARCSPAVGASNLAQFPSQHWLLKTRLSAGRCRADGPLWPAVGSASRSPAASWRRYLLVLYGVPLSASPRSLLSLQPRRLAIIASAHASIRITGRATSLPSFRSSRHAPLHTLDITCTHGTALPAACWACPCPLALGYRDRPYGTAVLFIESTRS